MTSQWLCGTQCMLPLNQVPPTAGRQVFWGVSVMNHHCGADPHCSKCAEDQQQPGPHLGAYQKGRVTGPLSPGPTEWDSAFSQDSRWLHAQGRAQTRGGKQAPRVHPRGRLLSQVTQSDALASGGTQARDHL